MLDRKLKVAVFISSSLQVGGGYQYEKMVIDLIKKKTVKNIDFKFYTIEKFTSKDYGDYKNSVIRIKENVFQKIHRKTLSNLTFHKLLKKINKGLSFIEKKLLKDKVDIIYFISPNWISESITKIPYIFTLFDLCHLENPELPELADEFEDRENLYGKVLKKSFKVIVDSNFNKSYSIQKYGLSESRVEVLKYLPREREIKQTSKIDIKKKYSIKNDYIFYPAQFWAHKNHIYILKALKILKEKDNKKISVIFSGSDKGNLKYILDKSKEYKISELVHYIGFISDDEIPFLYKQSLALVMPTYLGPTNIPPLEAFYYNTTVCYSDKDSFREQTGNAAYYLDLNDPKSLVKHIKSIYKNKKLVASKKKAGKKILSSWTNSDFYNKLIDIFEEFLLVRDMWK